MTRELREPLSAFTDLLSLIRNWYRSLNERNQGHGQERPYLDWNPEPLRIPKTLIQKNSLHISTCKTRTPSRKSLRCCFGHQVFFTFTRNYPRTYLHSLGLHLLVLSPSPFSPALTHDRFAICLYFLAPLYARL